MLLKAVNLNICLTNADLLLETEVLNENKVICFNKQFGSTKRLIINDLAGFWFDKQLCNTKRLIINGLAGFGLINTFLY